MRPTPEPHSDRYDAYAGKAYTPTRRIQRHSARTDTTHDRKRGMAMSDNATTLLEQFNRSWKGIDRVYH